MAKFLISVVVSLAALSAGSLASAAGQGGGASHGTGAGMTNSNNIKATDRDFGKERAADRTKVNTKDKAALNSNGTKSIDKDTGMGPCQGRQCGYTVAHILAQEQNRKVAELGFYRIRPPLKPVTLAELASLNIEDEKV